MKKLIDIPDEEIERLKLEAVKSGLSFKKYLEHKLLDSKEVVLPTASGKTKKVKEPKNTKCGSDSCTGYCLYCRSN